MFLYYKKGAAMVFRKVLAASSEVYAPAIYALQGCVNAVVWRGHAPGCVKVLGIEGQPQADGSIVVLTFVESIPTDWPGISGRVDFNWVDFGEDIQAAAGRIEGPASVAAAAGPYSRN